MTSARTLRGFSTIAMPKKKQRKPPIRTSRVRMEFAWRADSNISSIVWMPSLCSMIEPFLVM